ncbi:hypothetical protein LTR78_009839 [Recurvomyces mirabilis]|uniref:FAD-binding PCMH-type domain-containing protein n=1 Tax=Recurvomyces mirabilis TaxID=574656 RepID=A0AAE0WIB9_9PEZI|nr:hypothetical protein LTR78_009839 [Recurvomyces mirabilis]KAK5153075.1 hypothetical protein LTS14_007719 [Recurvomyces mirabilis]
MPSARIPSEFDELRALLLTSEVFEPGQQEYKTQSLPWSRHAEQNPKLVVQPTTLERLQEVVKFLYISDLDFAIRNTGTGSVSASDVLVSMHGFKSFAFDEASESIIVGAGLDWGEVDKLMEIQALGYAAVGARCPWVGVTGSTLVGGLSWLSHQYGMISDPQNLLDAQVVLGDGKLVWAAKDEEDLMWALRGGGGNFGVVTALKFRVRPYPEKIFGGILFIPYSSLHEVSKGVAAMAARTADPRIAMHVMNQGPGMGMPDQGSKPNIALMLFDAHGETHARSESGFAWAFSTTGAQEISAGIMSLQQMHALTETFRDYQGGNIFWLTAPLLEGKLDDMALVRVWKWYEDTIKSYPGFGDGSTVLLEFMQENAFNSSPSRTSTAWPHSGHRHVMQVVVGCKTSGSSIPDIKEKAHARLAAVMPEVAGDKATKEYHAGFLNEFNHVSEVYGENYERLREVKKRYDPQNRFNRGVDLVAGKVTEDMTV